MRIGGALSPRSRAGLPCPRTVSWFTREVGAMARRTKGSSTESTDEEDALDELFGLPLDEFTKARDRLAKELQAAGDSAAATRVKSLRKPSTAAWAINQLARRHRGRIEALLKAGDRIRESQREGAAGLREASREHHDLVWELLQLATNVLADAGVRAPGNHLDAIRVTLQSAATASDYERGLLREGRLTEELAFADFGDVMRMLEGSVRSRGLPEAEEVEEEEEVEAEVEEGEEVEEEEAPRKRPAKTGARAKQAAKRAAAREKQAEARRRKAEKQAAAREKQAAKRAAKQAAAREAKQEARERRSAEQAEARQRAEARRAYDEARREAKALAKQAERASAAAERADQVAKKAEDAAKEARARADEAERAAEEAQARAAEAEEARAEAEAALEGE